MSLTLAQLEEGDDGKGAADRRPVAKVNPLFLEGHRHEKPDSELSVAERTAKKVSGLLLTFGLDIPIHTLNTVERLRSQFRRERGMPPISKEDLARMRRLKRDMTWKEKLRHCIPLRITQQGALALCLIWTLLMFIVPVRLMLPASSTDIAGRPFGRFMTTSVWVALHVLVVPRLVLLPYHILYGPVGLGVRVALPVINGCLFGLALGQGANFPHVFSNYYDNVSATDQYLWIAAHVCFMCTLALPLLAYWRAGRFDMAGHTYVTESETLDTELRQVRMEPQRELLTSLPPPEAKEITTSSTGIGVSMVLVVVYLAFSIVQVLWNVPLLPWYLVVVVFSFSLMIFVAQSTNTQNDPSYLFALILGNFTVPVTTGGFFLSKFLQASGDDFSQVMLMTGYILTMVVCSWLWQTLSRYAFTPVRSVALVFPLQLCEVLFTQVAMTSVNPFSSHFFYLHIILGIRLILSSSGLLFFLAAHAMKLFGKAHSRYATQVRIADLWQLKSQQFLAQLIVGTFLLLIGIVDLMLNVGVIDESSSLGLPVLTKDMNDSQRGWLLLVLLYLMGCQLLIRPILGVLRKFLVHHLPNARVPKPHSTTTATSSQAKYTVTAPHHSGVTELLNHVRVHGHAPYEEEGEPLPPPPPPPTATIYMCDNCDEETAVYYCQECKQKKSKLCQECNDLLHLSKSKRIHERVPIAEYVPPTPISLSLPPTPAPVPPAVSGWALLKTLGKKNTALAPLKGAAEAQKKLQPVPHKGIRSLKLKLAALQGMQSMHNSQHHNNALMMSGETGNAGRTIELQRRLGARGEAEKAAEILAERRAAEDAALEAAEMKTHTGVDEEPEAEKLKYIPELHLEKVGRDGRPHTVLFEGSIFVYVVTCVAYACVAALYTVNSVSFEQLVV